MVSLIATDDEHTKRLLEHSQEVIEHSNRVLKEFDAAAMRMHEICDRLEELERLRKNRNVTEVSDK